MTLGPYHYIPRPNQASFERETICIFQNFAICQYLLPFCFETTSNKNLVCLSCSYLTSSCLANCCQADISLSWDLHFFVFLVFPNVFSWRTKAFCVDDDLKGDASIAFLEVVLVRKQD